MAGVAEPLNIGAEAPRQLADQTGKLRQGLISLVVLLALAAGLLLAVPGLHSVLQRIEHAQPGWIIAAVVLELLSCFGYVLVFMLVFAPLERRFAVRLAFAEQAANSIVSVAGAGGLALGAWVLRARGMPGDRIARRSVAMFLLTGAVNVVMVAILGLAMAVGLLAGSHQELLTLVPATVAVAILITGLTGGALARRIANGAGISHPRRAAALNALSDGVEDALGLLRSRDPRLFGALGYWLFDNLVLYACFRAFGATPAISAVAMAYLVGLLANAVPLPGGFVIIDGGLVGALLLYGVHPASLDLAAVLTYRAISAWIPSLGGLVAFASLRREIARAA